MNNDLKHYTVKIFGVDYSLVSDEKYESIMLASSLVDEAMQIIAQENKSLSVQFIAILVALRFAHQQHSLQEKLTQEKNTLEGLISHIDQSLDKNLLVASK